MKLLVLGGTLFMSRAVAQEGVRRGHDVTCACRGVSGSVPSGARHVVWDRSTHDPPPAPPVEEDDPPLASPVEEGRLRRLHSTCPEEVARRPSRRNRLETRRPSRNQTYDAVVDVARHPSRVRSAVAAFPNSHWVFVSTISVYADESTPNGTPETLSLRDPIDTDEDPTTGPEVYGAMKVACEQIIREGAASSTVIRPGLIAGPGDPSGRFTYWPDRLADGGEVLAPGSPDDAVQVIDVRDLAAWIVDAAEARTPGVFDAVSSMITRAEFLDQMADGLGAEPHLTWVDQEFLAEHAVEPWAGPRAVPVWLPQPEYAGLMAHDVRPSYAAGLRTRPIGDTARDTLAWLREHPDATVTGIDREHEAAVLREWHSLRG